jgi:integration host factor subunit beta
MADAFFGILRDALLSGERVEIRGFGSLTVKHYGSYLGRNPRTGAQVLVKPKRQPCFRPAKYLKGIVNNPPEPGTAFPKARPPRGR